MGDESFLLKGIIGVVAVVGGILVIVLPMSFGTVEYYEYAFARQKSTGKVDMTKVYSSGKHFIGPDYEFKKFRADSHHVSLSRIAAFTQDKLEVRISAHLQYFVRKHELPLLHKQYDIYYEDVMRSSSVDAIKMEITATFQYFLRKNDLPLLHKAYDIYYQDVVKSSSVDAVKVTVSASYQYFLRKLELPLLHKAYDTNYRDVIERNGVDAVKGSVTVFNTREMFLNRSQVEAVLFEAVRQRLGGICCPTDCSYYQNGECPNGCKQESCSDKEKGIFVDVRYFQLGRVEIPDEVENRFLKQLTLTEETLKEQLLQNATVVRKETEAMVRNIANEAGEISQLATSHSQLIKSSSQANYTNIIETARSKGLQKLFNNLGITDQKHKNSFDYLRTLRGLDNVHLTVDFQQRIAGTL